MKKVQFALILFGIVLLLAGCISPPPAGLQPVTGFEPDRYLGVWYEIARLDHPFEKNLSHVTAEYVSCTCPGAIIVFNRGFNYKKEEWQTVCGTARFLGPRDRAALKVTFFWPFYAPYYVIALDKEGYEWAMVTSGSREYLWILARRPELDEETLTTLVSQAEQWGFVTENLIFPAHH